MLEIYHITGEKMKLKNYLTEAEDELKMKLMDFFKKNPNPPDSKVHAFADELGIEHDKVEAAIYALLTSYIKDLKGEK